MKSDKSLRCRFLQYLQEAMPENAERDAELYNDGKEIINCSKGVLFRMPCVERNTK